MKECSECNDEKYEKCEECKYEKCEEWHNEWWKMKNERRTVGRG